MSDTEGLPISATDGRRRRGEDNRARIVQAMLESVRLGDYTPSAEQVALRAEVSLRTVFRHFEDMERLYREITSVVEVEFRDVATQPFESEDWRGRVVEMIARRTAVYEKVAPYRRAAEAHRHRSKVVASNFERITTVMREILRAHVPAEFRDTDLFETVDLLLSFEAWSRLRRDQNLPVKRARALLETQVRRLLDSVPG